MTMIIFIMIIVIIININIIMITIVIRILVITIIIIIVSFLHLPLPHDHPEEPPPRGNHRIRQHVAMLVEASPPRRVLAPARIGEHTFFRAVHGAHVGLQQLPCPGIRQFDPPDPCAFGRHSALRRRKT